jgi:amino acid transporter
VVGPFAGLAGVAGLGWLSILLRLDAFISPFGTGLVYQTSTSRIGYSLARNRYYPQIFARVDKNGVPWVSLILAFLLGLVFLLPFPSWKSLVGLVTSASVLMYAAAPLSLGAFRKQVPEASRPYRVPGPPGWRRRHSSSPARSSTGRALTRCGSSASASRSATC